LQRPLPAPLRAAPKAAERGGWAFVLAACAGQSTVGARFRSARRQAAPATHTGSAIVSADEQPSYDIVAVVVVRTYVRVNKVVSTSKKTCRNLSPSAVPTSALRALLVIVRSPNIKPAVITAAR